MTLKLPPLHVVLPPSSLYREFPLPPDLFETWAILRGLAWVNKYVATPPASLDELLKLHHHLQRRALEYRIERLERTGWVTVQRTIGKSNIYTPIVPPDEPIDYSVKTVHCGEPTSLRGVSLEESARSATESRIESAEVVSCNTPAMGCTGFSSTVVVDKNNLDYSNQTTTSTSTRAREKFTEDERAKIERAFWDMGIGESAWDELYAYDWMSVEYALAWLEHKRIEGKRLGGGFYRMQMRKGCESPYDAARKIEKVHVLTRNDFSDAQWQRMTEQNRDLVLEGHYTSETFR